MSALIKKIHAREILDSRGNPTVEVEVTLDDGSLGRAAVPSGASTGVYEALELRDGDKARYGARASSRPSSTSTTRSPRPSRASTRWTRPRVDRAMLALDGTANKSKLGANAILGVSLAVARAAAVSRRAAALPLPRRGLGQPPAGADVQHPERRRPRQLAEHGPPGVHDRAGRRAELPRGAALGGGDLSRAQGRAQEQRLHDGRRRRGRLRPGLQEECRRGRERSSRPSRRPATSRARTSASGHRPARRAASTRTASTTCGPRTGRSRPARWWRCTPSGSQKYPIVVIEDGLAEDDWDGWKLLNQTIGGKIRARRRRPVRDQRRAHRPRHQGERGQLRADQAEPDRHADRDRSRPSRWPARPAGAPWSRTGAARRSTASSPT